MAYASRARAPRTLTPDERTALLERSGRMSATYRDHMLFALALGTGLREHELVALDVGDVLDSARRAKERVQLRTFKWCTRHAPAPQDVFPPPALRAKLERFGRWKSRRGESLAPESALFVSRQGPRLATRTVRYTFRRWADQAGLARGLTFHSLRHTFCQSLYEATGDLRLVQSAARHLNLATTTIYAGPSPSMIARAVACLEC